MLQLYVGRKRHKRGNYVEPNVDFIDAIIDVAAGGSSEVGGESEMVSSKDSEPFGRK